MELEQKSVEVVEKFKFMKWLLEMFYCQIWKATRMQQSKRFPGNLF